MASTSTLSCNAFFAPYVEQHPNGSQKEICRACCEHYIQQLNALNDSDMVVSKKVKAIEERKRTLQKKFWPLGSKKDRLHHFAFCPRVDETVRERAKREKAIQEDPWFAHAIREQEQEKKRKRESKIGGKARKSRRLGEKGKRRSSYDCSDEEIDELASDDGGLDKGASEDEFLALLNDPPPPPSSTPRPRRKVTNKGKERAGDGVENHDELGDGRKKKSKGKSLEKDYGITPCSDSGTDEDYANMFAPVVKRPKKKRPMSLSTSLSGSALALSASPRHITASSSMELDFLRRSASISSASTVSSIFSSATFSTAFASASTSTRDPDSATDANFPLGLTSQRPNHVQGADQYRAASFSPFRGDVGEASQKSVRETARPASIVASPHQQDLGAIEADAMHADFLPSSLGGPAESMDNRLYASMYEYCSDSE